MKNTNFSDRFRQSVQYSVSPRDIVRVDVGKYVLAHKKHIRHVQTILWSCVGLIGHRDGHGFAVQVFSPKQASAMLQQLQIDVRREVGCALEDFNIAISWGNHLSPNNTNNVGRLNIEAVLDSLDRIPDIKVHLGKNSGNVVKLSLDTGKLEFRQLDTAAVEFRQI